MNDQQRAAMIRPRGKSEAPHMIAAYRAMQMALEALEDWKAWDDAVNQYPVWTDKDKVAITALREALENNELSDVTLINEGDMAQPQVAPDGRVAKTVFTFEDMQKAAEMGYESGKAEAEALAHPQGKECKYNSGICNRRGCRGICQATELGKKYRELEAQPQGEWVDLTPHEVTEQIREGAADGGWQGFAQRITAKFKEKNTPPVVPQGEPVAKPFGWWGKRDNGINFTTDPDEELKYKYWQPLYTTPPSVEAAIEATLEKAAKVVEELKNPKDDLSAYSDGWIGGTFDCAAAIRSMK